MIADSKHNIINRHSNYFAEFSSAGGSLGFDDNRVASTTLNGCSNYNIYRHSMYLLCRNLISNICLWNTKICRWSIFKGQVNRQSIEPIGELKLFTFKFFIQCRLTRLKLSGSQITWWQNNRIIFLTTVVFSTSGI